MRVVPWQRALAGQPRGSAARFAAGAPDSHAGCRGASPSFLSRNWNPQWTPT